MFNYKTSKLCFENQKSEFDKIKVSLFNNKAIPCRGQNNGLFLKIFKTGFSHE